VAGPIGSARAGPEEEATEDIDVRAVTLDELASEAGVEPALVQRLIDLEEIRPLPDGRFDARDEVILGTVRALLAAGISLEDLVWAIETGRFGMSVIGRLFTDPSPRIGTHADLGASMGPLADRMAPVHAAIGLASPAPDTPLGADEARILRDFVRIWGSVDPTGRADVRVARLVGEAMRRVAEGWLEHWDEYARPSMQSQGAPSRSPQDGPPPPEENPTVELARVARELVAWVFERSFERALRERIVSLTESILISADRMPPRPERPPAIAFVDLSGYTSMTVELGDEQAVAASERLRELAEGVANEEGGRLVKLLGDGALLRFDDPASAIRGTLGLVDAVADAALPPLHAGIAAGTVIVRDGDVFGRTVNLASRVAGQANPGEVLVEEGVVVALPRGTARFEAIGRRELRGFSEPIALWRATKT
jgi:class 3 adenylate cyclase